MWYSTALRSNNASNIKVIVDYFKLSEKDQLAASRQIKEIFFESSSRKNFKTDLDKETFFKNWTSYYLDNPAQKIWLWQNKNAVTESYLMACCDSKAAKSYYESRIPSYVLFEDLFSQYPAHLHINSSPDVRGQGVGTKLIQHCIEQLRNLGLKGVHLITSPDARNVDFYKKNGFGFSTVRQFKDSELLFLGQELSRV